MKIIFHIPKKLNNQVNSGGKIRILNMYQTFMNLGYDVDLVSGSSRQRKKKIKEIKNKISNGTKYDFLYAESSTLPVALTDDHHLPLHPFMDFNFFKFIKKNDIKIGLFYRDIYWNFEEYKNKVSWFKRKIGNFFYKYDLKKYNELLDILYLPSLKMNDYIPYNFNIKIKSLPPGLRKKSISLKKEKNSIKNSTLKIFYVGGIGEFYGLNKLFKTVYNNKNVKLTVCCRKSEWEKYKNKYNRYINKQVNIVHASGDDLIPYFLNSDISSLFLKPIKYRSFAMPTKLFEYMKYKTPIIATNNTAAGEFVKNNNIGWTIDYSKDELNNLLNYISNNRQNLAEKRKNIVSILDNHTWEKRAVKVVNDLK